MDIYKSADVCIVDFLRKAERLLRKAERLLRKAERLLVSVYFENVMNHMTTVTTAVKSMVGGRTQHKKQ